MLEIFSKQYKYSIVHVHLVGKLEISLLHESAWNINLHHKLTESSNPLLQNEITPGESSRCSDYC
jgi:hypothetical protein